LNERIKDKKERRSRKAKKIEEIKMKNDKGAIRREYKRKEIEKKAIKERSA